MDRQELIKNIRKKKSLLCVGLDTDIRKIPNCILEEFDNPVLEFNKRIIKATSKYAVAYKLNTAFYEAEGVQGWKNLEETIKMIPKDIFIIADAKRADIGNTSKLYARAFFENMNSDAVTVAPYMGNDSVSPFMEYEGKWIILLALTSNGGSRDFQNLKLKDTNKSLYEQVIETSSSWGTDENMMYVVGATHPEDFKAIRRLIPNHFLLVPGVGAQGGDLEGVIKNGMNDDFGLLINSSRGIIFASDSKDFDIVAGQKAKELRDAMSEFM